MEEKEGEEKKKGRRKEKLLGGNREREYDEVGVKEEASKESKEKEKERNGIEYSSKERRRKKKMTRNKRSKNGDMKIETKIIEHTWARMLARHNKCGHQVKRRLGQETTSTRNKWFLLSFSFSPCKFLKIFRSSDF